MTTYIQTAAPHVEAEQWDGSDESLHRIQRLLFPRSPWRSHYAGLLTERMSSSLGVPVLIGMSEQMVTIDVGMWVVQYPGGRVATMTDAEFHEWFTPPPAPPLQQPTPATVDAFDESLRDA